MKREGDLRKAARTLASARNGLLAARARLRLAMRGFVVLTPVDEDILSPLRHDIVRWENAMEDAILGVLLAESSLGVADSMISEVTPHG